MSEMTSRRCAYFEKCTREKEAFWMKRYRIIKGAVLRAAAVVLVVALVIGCAGVPKPRPAVEPAAEEKPEAAAEEGAALTETQESLVEGARKLEGAKRLLVRGKEFRMDCTGAVAAVYWYAGIDILSPLARYSGNGVLRLYRYMEEEELLVPADSPAPGDIVFWDNTYDKDDDGKPNDFLTHTGVVVSADENGTVVYYHHNYRRGIVLERMNVIEPHVHTKRIDGREVVINTPMRMRGSPDFDLWLAGQLVKSYGRGWRLSQ
jgi:hypothetical protein